LTFVVKVRKIRQLLRSRGLGGVRVGDVASYQGQDERIIIVSTVETGEVATPSRMSLLGHPRRFNMTITRAKELLVVVGNPHHLVGDACWKMFLAHTLRVGTAVGESIPLAFPAAPSSNPSLIRIDTRLEEVIRNDDNDDDDDNDSDSNATKQQVLSFAQLGDGWGREPIAWGDASVWRVGF
jgi:hypothetical protein